jgi:glycerol-3-phosphate dehydrogenase subunit B
MSAPGGQLSAGRSADVAVIGGGLAGLCAAIAAAKRGLRVVVVRRGLGTTAMSSGGLDFPADLPRLYGAGVGGPGATSAATSAAAGTLGDWFRAAGAELRGRPGEEMLLLDTAGEVRSTNLALVQHATGSVEGWSGQGGKLLLLGVAGYPSFRPEWVRHRVVAAGLLPAERVAAGRVAVLGFKDESDLPAARLARALEVPDTAKSFASAVGRAAREAGAAFVALPPVLGLEKASEVFRLVAETVAAHAPVAVFELLSPPPSVPGQRLQDLLDRVAGAAGVAIASGRVTGAGAVTGAAVVTWAPAVTGAALEAAPGPSAPEILASVTVESSGRCWTLSAREFILATGKYAAGGLDAGGFAVAEPVFGLAVFVPPPPGWPAAELPAGQRLVREMVYDRFAARHPVFEAGLAVDWRLRPLGGDGRTPRFANLRAAGSVLGGYNHFADGAGSGVAVVTGLEAGRLAAEAAASSASETGGAPASETGEAPARVGAATPETRAVGRDPA